MEMTTTTTQPIAAPAPHLVAVRRVAREHAEERSRNGYTTGGGLDYISLLILAVAALDAAEAEAAALRERVAHQQALLASLMNGDGGKIAGVDPLRED